MEGAVFPLPAVAGELRASFIEARLHTDGEPPDPRNNQLREEMTGSTANPIFVVYDPVTREVLRKRAGYMGGDRFLKFLRGR